MKPVTVFTKDVGETKERILNDINYEKQLEDLNQDYIKMELKIR